MSTISAGKLGEETAIKYLQKSGYKILTKNFRSRFGEIDIIAIDPSDSPGRGTLVFVEVKTRWNKAYGYPQDAVTPRKIRSIIKTSEYFKILNPKTPELMRIDVVAIEVEDQEVIKVELIKNASF